ncbi:E3 ubiquitin-protein ligase TRIM39-like [Protopterus annectens]|uniref:E3 ubiquitin-protein ligase TRIM39-like n=1 Tax=Protopterus annectens TaxID=7888 RepID=UPI001CFAED89|nr:E3 ubiquitin-protein ligase TRIM39-like [Protopterus annectens]
MEVNVKTSEQINICGKHKEECDMFCDDDKHVLCSGCSESQEGHSILCLSEATATYKQKIEQSLGHLKKQLEKTLKPLNDETRKLEEIKTIVDSQKQKIVEEFEQLHQFLKKEQAALLTKLHIEEETILEAVNKNIRALSLQSCTLQNLIEGIQKELWLQHAAFLKNAESTLQRCDCEANYNIPEASPEFESSRFHFPLQYFVWKRMNSIIIPAVTPLTLDPETANPRLILSEDMKTLQFSVREQDVSQSPNRFRKLSAVLSNEGFTSGRHYWEVEVGDARGWTLGAVRESVDRTGITLMIPEDGYWVLGRWWAGDYWVGGCDIHLAVEPRRIGIQLDYEKRWLSFYNADTMSHLYTFKMTCTEKIFPYFSNSDKDSEIVIVSTVALPQGQSTDST